MMKKHLSRIIVLIVVFSLLASAVAAFAASDVVIKKAALYSSSSLKKAIGTIPAWTSVSVGRSSKGVTKVKYQGKTGYVKNSCLVPETLTYTGSKKLLKGTRVYQRPTTSSVSVKAPKTMYVLFIGSKRGWTLCRTDDVEYDAIYIFVKSSKLV